MSCERVFLAISFGYLVFTSIVLVVCIGILELSLSTWVKQLRVALSISCFEMLLFFVTLDFIFGFGSHIYLFRIKKDFDCGEVLKNKQKIYKTKKLFIFSFSSDFVSSWRKIEIKRFKVQLAKISGNFSLPFHKWQNHKLC